MGKLIGNKQPSHRVGWRSKETQEARFNALLGIDDLHGKSILDLGCGLGCLYGYLKDLEWEGEYTGFDVMDMMVNGAKKRFPEVTFENRNILLDPPRRQWDYVFISGIFNHRVKDNWAWIEATIKLSLELSRLGVGFNLLETKEDNHDPLFFYVKRKELEPKVALWSEGRYKIIDHYLEDDVTVHLLHPKGNQHG